MLLLLLYTGLQAQVSEKESNNTRATADTLHELVVKKGAVNSNPDNNDYFKTLLPADGTIKIYLAATNTGAGKGYFYVRVYNKKGDQLYSDVVARKTDISPGQTVKDTVTLYSLGADSLYINMYADNQPFSYLLSYALVDRSTNDAEPNNTAATPLPLPINTTVNGHIGYTTNGIYDANDYYKVLPPADGTVKINLQVKNTGGDNGYIYFRVFNKKGDQLYSDVVGRNTHVAPGQTIKDSIALYSIGKDSLYYNVYADNRSFSYQLSYTIKDTSTNDAEPDNSAAQARNLAENAVTKGHIGYTTNGSYDANDYYKTAITKAGTVKIAVSGINTGGDNGYFYIMVFNKKGDQLYSDVVSRNTAVKPLQQVNDTVVLYSAGADSMYFRIYADNRSFAYQLSYQVQNISEDDAEPNNTFGQASFIFTNELKKGHIGYTTNSVYDANDYYKTVLPADGTMKVAVTGTNTGGNNGYFYIQVFNKKGDQLYSDVVGRNTTVKPNQQVKDTVKLYNLGRDTMYMRVYADNVSFSYNISYQLTDSSANDVEPDNNFAQATNINEKQLLKGHIGYTTNGVYDNNDYYKTLFNAYGTNKIYITAKNNGGSNGYIYFRVYNKKGDQLYSDVVARNTSVTPGNTINDTITLTGLGRDSLYYNVYADNRGFSYQFSYVVTDTAADDKEPNDVAAQATWFAEKQVMKGHIGYRTNSLFDANDYYKTLNSAAATTRILVSAKNTGYGNGYVYLRVYNNRGNEVLSKVVANNTSVKPGQTVVDTTYLYGLGKDTLYYNIYADNQSFHYQLGYTLVDTAASDIEPNNSREQGTKIAQGQLVKGNIGYRTNGDYDANDYFKNAIPNKIGAVKIFVAAKNTSSNNGYVYVFVYNNSNNQLVSKVVANRTDVKPGETVRDTILISCIESDSIIVRMYADNQPFAYELKYQYTGGPAASFGYIKYGNRFSFIDSSKNLPADNTYQWQFISGGNQIGTSTLSKPDFDFPADKFNTVKLTVGNGCLLSSITVPLVEAGKVSYYSPSTGQANTEVLVNFTGGNFDKNAKIFLKKKSNPSVSYTSLRGGSPSSYQFAAYFDLHNVTAAGEYFFEVVFSNGAKDTVPFTVLPYTNQQANVQLSLSGPGFMRNGLTSYYNLTVTNTSNKQALGVPVWFAVPNELNAEVMTPTVRLKRISKGIQDTVPLYMKTIGTIDGIREERKVFFMMLGTLGAKETVTIPVRVTQPEHAGKQTRVYAWADQPMYGSPMRDNWKNALKSLSKYVSGRYADSTCTDEALADGGWEAISQAIFNGDSTGTNIISNYYLYTEPLTWKLVDLVFHCYSDVHISRNMMYSLIYNTLFVAHLDEESAPPPGGTKNTKDTIGANNKDTDKWDNGKKDDINPPVLDSLGNCPKGDCFPTDPFDFDKLKKRPNGKIKPVLNPDNPTLITYILLSIDPNRIDGPGGYTVRRHTKTSANSSYTIHFENKPEATASAQTVVVADTLDKAKYNFSTFSLASFTIGDSLYLLPPGAKEYSATVGIKQFTNVKVWFYAKFDTLTGVLTTRYATVDPATNDVVPATDPRGFLPPNTTSPKGEGSITYSIAFKASLASGTQVNNKASIVFDNNAPLITNTWSNIIDTTAPTGKVAKAVKVNDSTAMLVLTGNDAHSGVRMYRIFAARNGGAFVESGFTTSDTVYFSGYKGSSYSFYAEVFDSVYNHTTKSAIAEASVTLPVDMLPLTGTSFGKINTLYWTTVTETNNSGFYVERSNDGASFNSIGFVQSQAANGYSAQRLNYTFNDAFASAHNWYRIKQVDKDGHYSYSNIVDLNNNATGVTRVYPNPARNNFFISSGKKITAIRLLDVSGRVVKQFTPVTNSSYNITGLPAGLYFCEITMEDGREVIKLSIQ